jgi:hypothetical protein
VNLNVYANGVLMILWPTGHKMELSPFRALLPFTLYYYKYLYAPFPTQPKEVDMKHEELHIRAHNAGTNTRLAMGRVASKSSVIAKRVALKTADATLAGITVVTSFTSAVTPRRKR